MSRPKRHFWTGGIALGCAALALLFAPALLRGHDSVQPSPSSAPDNAPRFIMNPFLQTSNPQQMLLKEWLDIHQRMATPVKYIHRNSPLRGDRRFGGC